MVKVLHFAPGFREGGIESRLVDWYEKIDRRKVQFVLVKANSDDSSPKLRRLEELGCRHYNIPHFSLKTYATYVKEIREIIYNEKPAVVHVHNPFTGYFVLKEAKKQGVPIRILHSRTTDFLPNEKNVFIKKALRHFSPKYATHYFGCSQEAGEWGIGKKYSKNIRVIKNGINLERFEYSDEIRKNIRSSLGISEDRYVVGTVGRLSPQKNITKIIRVFKKITEKNPNAVLVIVGEGSEREIIENTIHELGITDNVILTGSKSDVFNYYMAFDVFLSTSLYEGFGTTAVEAQATGLPTVLSEGFPEMVELTDYVYRLPLEQSDEYWSDIILKIGKRDRSKYDTLKIDKAGFSSQSVAKELENVYCGELD